MKKKFYLLSVLIVFLIAGCSGSQRNSDPQQSIFNEDTVLNEDRLYKLTYKVPEGVGRVIENQEFYNNVPSFTTVYYLYPNGTSITAATASLEFVDDIDTSKSKSFEVDGVTFYYVNDGGINNALCFLDGYAYSFSMPNGADQLEEFVKTLGVDPSGELPVLEFTHEDISYTLPEGLVPSSYVIENEYVDVRRKCVTNTIYYTYGNEGEPDYFELTISRNKTTRYKDVRENSDLYDNIEINGSYFRGERNENGYYPEYLLKTEKYVYLFDNYVVPEHLAKISDYEKDLFEKFINTVKVEN